ncbi:flagellar basal body P-ring formation chaperone FlgA [Lentibacter sp.]|uniref:flagellar basal body P-ring formation chaperone FlgA n=1 Tax=Lentibacter sp. TaxID=2024994 RepID=UPI003F6A40C0
MRSALLIWFCLLSGQALADVIVAQHTIRPKTLITEEDLLLRPVEVLGALSDPADVVGKEARISLYAGRPIRATDLREPAVIDRNQVAKLSYQRGSLMIQTDARALDRASVGEVIKVMNLSSKTTLYARVLPDGTLIVDP